MKSNREILSAIEVELRKRPLNDREKAEKEFSDRCKNRWLQTMEMQEKLAIMQRMEMATNRIVLSL